MIYLPTLGVQFPDVELTQGPLYATLINGFAVAVDDFLGQTDLAHVTGNILTINYGATETNNDFTLVLQRNPGNQTSTVTITFPYNNGTVGQILQVDSNGYLSWVNPSTVGFQDPMTSAGDIIIRNGSNVTSRLAVGSAGQYLKAVGGVPTWATAVSSVSVSSPLAVANPTTTPSISIPAANGSVDGYLSSTDWLNFDSKEAALPWTTTGDLVYYGSTSPARLAAPTSPPTSNTAYRLIYNWYAGAPEWQSFGTLTVNYSVAAPLYANYITPSSTEFNILQATSSQDGYLTSTDWVTFNTKQPLLPWVNTGDLLYYDSGSQKLGIGSTGQVLTVSGGLPVWSTPASTSITINTSSPLTGGGTATTFNLAVSQATASTDGYLSSTDWNTFNNKQPAGSYALQATSISTTSPLQGGGDLSTSRTLSILQASSSQSGYLSSTDWSTFNSKQAALGYTPVNKAGDTMTGALDMGSFKITSLANGTSTNDAVNYGQLTSLVTGLIWQNPVLDPDIVNDSLSTPPGSPTISATYIIGASPTGAWAAHAGHVVWWDGANWIDVSTGDKLKAAGSPVQIGDRFLVASAHDVSGLIGGNFTGQQYKIAVVTNATPGSYAYTFTSPVNNWALSVNGIGSNHVGSSFTYSSTLGSWVNFSGPSQVGVGDGLSLLGNTINVNYDDSTIATNGSNQLYVKSGGITNTQVNASAAIAYSKLALSNSIVNADISTTAAIAYSKLNLASSIATSDLASGFLLPSTNGGTGVNNAGTLTYGSNNLTFTTSGTTNVTLPISGTLLANSRAINTSAPLSGGGDLSADRTLSISQASAGSDGYLSSTDWSTFNSKISSVTINTTSPLTGGASGSSFTLAMPQATSLVDGFLSSTDWSTFNAKQNALGFTPANSTTTISTTSPLSGGGDLSTNRTLSIAQATVSTSGYLSSTDWSTFNSKEPAITAGTTSQYWRGDKSFQTLDTLAVTENTNLYYTDTRARLALSATSPVAYDNSTGVISMGAATALASGYLSSTDWAAFDSKQAALGYTPVNKAGDTMSGALTLGPVGTSAGDGGIVKLTELAANGTNYVAFRAADSIVSSVTWTLPDADGTSGQVLSTNGSGVLSWSSGGGGGTVTSVTASAPLASSGGSTPNITITQANTTTDGYLSSTDWNTFNGKQAALGYTPVNKAGDTMSGTLTLGPIGTSAGQGGRIQFTELAANGTNFVAFKAADSITADVTWTLPSADGTNGQVLSTDGSGTLSWATASGGGGISGSGTTNTIMKWSASTTAADSSITDSGTAVSTTSTLATTNTTDSTSSTTGALKSSGGIAAVKNIVTGGQVASEFYDAGNSSTSITIDFNNGNVQQTTLTANTTISFSNPIDGASYVLIMIQDGTGGRTRAWGSTIKWAGGTEPSWSTLASRVDIATFLYAGGTWYGGANTVFA